MIVLKRKSRGAEVVELQRLLRDAGESIIPDGVFGGHTEEAVKNVQRRHGITVDGVVGKDTWTVLRPTATPPPLAAGKYALSEVSRKNLIGVHPDLVRVVERAIQITQVDFRVGEGVRTLARQKQLVAQKKSQTMRSRHVPESNACRMSCAVDLHAMPGGVLSWDWKYYEQINTAMQQAARELNIPIEWGGGWKTLKDGVHFQLPWGAYK